jgi:hypothetical protein
MNKLIAFGSSPIMKHNKTIMPYPQIIANRLGLAYNSQAKPLSSNSKIARKVLSYDCQDALVLVSWTSTTRTEFRTEHGWTSTNSTTHQSEFEKHWYQGPARWEYTGVCTTLKEIVLVQSFLKSCDIPYVFLYDNNEIIHSYLYQNPDEYLKSIISLIDQSKILLFEGQGFVPWCESQGYERQDGNHFETRAHEQAANIISAHFGPWSSEFLGPGSSRPLGPKAEFG